MPPYEEGTAAFEYELVISVMISDGEMTMFRDKDSTMKIHNLTETEFWDKYNAGDLGTAFYTYETDNIFTELFSEAILDTKYPFIEHDNKAFIAKSYFGQNSLTVVDETGNILGDYDLNDMLPSENSTLEFVNPYFEMARSFIGIDDTGYIYMNIRKITDGCIHTYGVVSANISDIGNPQSWNLLIDNSNLNFAFAPFNCCLPDREEATLINPDYLKVDDGGIFAFEWHYLRNSINFVNMINDSNSSKEGYGVSGDVYYFKNGQIVQWNTDAFNYYDISFWGGSRCFTVDKENNCLYVTTQYATAFASGDEQIGIKKISVDGTTEKYWIQVGDDLKKFETATSVMGSFLYYKNNKVFMYINNQIQRMLVLDLQSGLYSSTEQFSLNKSISPNERIISTSVYDNDVSISFINDVNQDYVYNGMPDERYLYSWNYNNDTLYVTSLTTDTTDTTVPSASIRNSLDIDLDGNIILVQRYSNNTNSLTKFNPNNHNIQYSYLIPSLRNIPPHHDVIDNYIFEEDKITAIILSYTFHQKTDGCIITIDNSGNVTTLYQTVYDDTVRSNERRPAFPLDENIYVISDSIYYDKKYMKIKAIRQHDYLNDGNKLNVLMLFNKLMLFKNQDKNYIFSKDGTKKVALLSMNNKIVLKEEG